MNSCARLFAISVLFTTGCSDSECSFLENVARKEPVRDYLKKWVDSRIASGDYALSESEGLGSVRLPGEYSINIHLDHDLLEMAEPEARPILDKHGKAVSFFFGQKTYRGIMIKGEESASYGFPIGRLMEIDDRTAVLCIDH